MSYESKRFWHGAAAGMVGTLAMAIVMVAAYLVGITREPMPLALLASLTSRIFHIASGATAYAFALPVFFVYGAFVMGLVGLSSSHMTWKKGLVIGIGLWVLMAVFFVPFAGRATFAIAENGGMWFVTLLGHVVYGALAGALATRERV